MARAPRATRTMGHPIGLDVELDLDRVVSEDAAQTVTIRRPPGTTEPD